MSKFVFGFSKEAVLKMPAWLQEAHKSIDGHKTKNYSKLGLKNLLKRRGIS